MIFADDEMSDKCQFRFLSFFHGCSIFAYEILKQSKMRTLVFIILLFVAAMSFATMSIAEDNRSVEDFFRETMNDMEYLTYKDPDFGYTFNYPSFFEKEKVDGYGVGHVQYAYHNGDVNLVMECKVIPDSVMKGKKSDFIQQGIVENMEDYSYYSHYVKRKNLYYILTLYYPTGFKKGIYRMFTNVQKWNPDASQYSKKLQLKLHR